jgi:hypothetical protein
VCGAMSKKGRILRSAPLVITPAQGKKQVTDCRGLQVCSLAAGHRGKPAMLHAPLPGGPAPYGEEQRSRLRRMPLSKS